MSKSRGIYRTAGTNRLHVIDNERAARAASKRTKVRVGDIVRRPWGTFAAEQSRKTPMVYARVIYVHPRGYYHVVSFPTKSGVHVNEAFSGNNL